MSDFVFMARALELAERGRGHVEPNPLVGAVVVRDGTIVGEGWHEKFGQPHAEVPALNQAGENARGSTLYVTLEPCCHFGKTPPCTEAVIRAGVRRVVFAMLDPFLQVSGQGAARLREAGIDVEVGVGEIAARRLNAPYLKHLRTGRPWVHAKWAMTLDGKLSTRTGESKWITGEAARAKVHELRGRMDAIVVGKGTLLADNPLLTARPCGPRVATRVVLTATGEGMPKDCQILKTIEDAPVLVIAGEQAVSRLDSWQARGATVVSIPMSGNGLDVKTALTKLGERGMTNILVEGGGETLGRFLDAGEIDEVHAFLAPMLVGGSKAQGPFAGTGMGRLSEALRFAGSRIEQLGNDVYIHGIANDSD